MRSATTSYRSDEKGNLRPEIIKLHERLSKGGVSLIVSGHLYVSDDGKPHRGMAGISSGKHVPRLRELTDVVHKHNGKIIAQFNHAGIYSLTDRAGPSIYQGVRWIARALDGNEIRGIVKDFGDAAERAAEAGFDGVQIHGAHGYLISQFLSKYSNRRKDEWGGSLENRMQLLFEVYNEIRNRLGGFPVMLKMNSDDFSQDGFTIEESEVVAENICKQGLDLVEISGGGVGREIELRPRARSMDPVLAEADFAGYASRIRVKTKPMALALVGGIRNRSTMEAIIEKDIADIISMSRPFIREPNLVNKLHEGQEESTCVSCDACNPLHGRGNVDMGIPLQCHRAYS